jgi:hypothetical protein
MSVALPGIIPPGRAKKRNRLPSRSRFHDTKTI